MTVDPARAMWLFQEVCDLDPAERERRLRDLCSEPELRDAVAAMIEADGRPSTFGVTGLGMRVLATDEAELPARIGPFEIVALLGEGGMGRVYDAIQTSPRRRVALKTLHRERVSEAGVARFEREGQLLAGLVHPGIPPVYATGVHDGTPWIAMERVEGQPITRWASERSLPVRERVRLLIAVCEAVHFAHLRGVVHRDIKPSNVLVGDDGRARVIDFGIALAEGDEGGELAGTPGWMAPEQLGVVRAPIDPRTDVWALAALGWRLIAGRPALPLQAASVEEAQHAVASRPASLVPNAPIPQDLAWVFDRGLQTDPERRYGSARALGRDLQRWLELRPVRARPGTWRYRATRMVQRQPLASGAAMLAVGTTAALVVGQGIALVRLDDARARADLERDRAQDARRTAEDARDELQRRLDELILERARAELDADPVAALGTLGLLGGAEVRGDAAAVVDSARARGLPAWVLESDGDPVRRVAFLGDDTVVGGSDSGVHQWALTGGSHRRLLGSIDDLRALGVGPGGVLVATPSGRLLGGPTPDLELPPLTAVARGTDGWWVVDEQGGLTRLDEQGAVRDRTSLPTVCEVALALGASEVAVGCVDGSVWRWAPPAAPMPGLVHGAGVTALGWGPPLATGGEDGVLLLQDGSGRFGGHDGEVRAIARSGELWVTADRAGKLFAWGPTGQVWAAQGHDGVVRDLVALDRGRVASGGEDGLVRIWSADGRSRVLSGHGSRVRDLAWSAAAGMLASAEESGPVRLWSLSGGEPGPQILDAAAPLTAMAVGPVVVGSADGEVRQWIPPEGEVRWKPHDDEVSAIAVRPSGVATAGRDGTLAWRTESGELRRTSSGEGPLDEVVVLDSGLVVAGARSGTRIHWMPGEDPERVHGHRARVRALAAQGDGYWSAADDRTVRRWTPEGETVVADDLDGIDMVPLGSGVLVATAAGPLVWLPEGREIPLDGPVTHLVASVDSGRVAALSTRRTLILVDEQGRTVREGLPGPVRALAIGEDGAVAWAAERGEVRIRWPDGRQQLALQYPGEVGALDLRDGVLVVGGEAGVLRVTPQPEPSDLDAELARALPTRIRPVGPRDR